METSLRRLFDELKNLRSVVVHPPGDECRVLVEQLRRIGCQVRTIWPFPSAPPGDADVVFFLVGEELRHSSVWCSSEVDATLIALAEYENPTALKLLLDTHAHGVITKPFRSSGVLNSVVLARSAKGFQDRQERKIRKLEDTIKARRQIDRAIRLLIDHQDFSENEAYAHMRERATGLRITVGEVAALVIEASEALNKLGLDGGPGKRAAR